MKTPMKTRQGLVAMLIVLLATALAGCSSAPPDNARQDSTKPVPSSGGY